jgi:Na+-driven multidrug efflux pump
VIDGVILGRFVGANALASVNLILPCYSLMTALSIVIGVGCQTLIGINLGRSDRQDAITTSFLFLGGISVLISGLIYIFAGDIARMLGANDVLVTGAVDYIRSLVPFFPLLSLMFLGDYMIKAMGHPLYAMIVMGSTVLINIGLDLLFIPVMGLGIKGAGLATGLGGLFNIPRMFQRGQVVAVQRGRFRWPLVWNALYNGSSEGISELSAGITIFLFNITMMRYLGEDGVAAFTAINYILFIATTVFLGISDGIIPIISYNFGAGRLDRIEKVLRLAGRVNFMIGITLFAILFFFGQQITSFFFKGGEALDALAIANYGITIYCFTFLMSGLNILASSYFTAIGNAKLSVVISMLRSLVFVTFGIIVYPSLFGIQSIWYNVPVAELCTLFISFMLVRRELLKEAVLKN